MAKETVVEGEGAVHQIEASGDAIIIADAIHALAGAIGQLAKAMREDAEPEGDGDCYLDDCLFIE